MIDKIYSEDEEHERLYHLEMENWLRTQPQDVSLLFVRGMNWDVYDDMIDRLIDQPCDIAVMTVVFWMSDPSFSLRNPGNRHGRNAVRIIENTRNGRYTGPELAQNRERDIAFNVHRYREALLDPSVEGRTLDIPKVLFGPFEGRWAVLPDYDKATRRNLDELLDATTSTLFLNEEQWRRPNSSHEPYALPDVPARPWEAFADLSELAYVERLYGPFDMLDRVVNWEKYRKPPPPSAAKRGFFAKLFCSAAR